jgi:hypothetical protein
VATVAALLVQERPRSSGRLTKPVEAKPTCPSAMCPHLALRQTSATNPLSGAISSSKIAVKTGLKLAAAGSKGEGFERIDPEATGTS